MMVGSRKERLFLWFGLMLVDKMRQGKMMWKVNGFFIKTKVSQGGEMMSFDGFML